MSKRYPRTAHVIFSPGATRDDRRLSIEEHNIFLGQRIIISEKLDGGSACFTDENVYARSHSGSPTHPSFDLAKQYHSQIKHLIGKDTSVFGEWCYAIHSIEYTHLKHCFNMFAVRTDSTTKWWSWDEVCMMAEMLDFPTVPVLFDGVISTIKKFQNLIETLVKQPSVYGPVREGVVIRIADSFVVEQEIDSSENVFKCVSKWVRPGHVQTSEHWSTQEIRKNGLSKC